MANQFRILVFGSRTFNDRETIKSTLLDELDYHCPATPHNEITLVHGAARGADELAADVAEAFGIRVEAHPADWTRHGKAAGPIRNSEMLASGVDCAIGFFDGPTPGSMDMLRKLITAGVEVRVIARKR